MVPESTVNYATYRTKFPGKKVRAFGEMKALIGTLILGLLLRFGIPKRQLLEQPTHLNQVNIGILFCSLSMKTFALKVNSCNP